MGSRDGGLSRQGRAPRAQRPPRTPGRGAGAADVLASDRDRWGAGGPEEDYSEFVAFAGEQVADRAPSAPAERALRSLWLKIDPERADWLGR